MMRSFVPLALLVTAALAACGGSEIDSQTNSSHQAGGNAGAGGQGITNSDAHSNPDGPAADGSFISSFQSVFCAGFHCHAGSHFCCFYSPPFCVVEGDPIPDQQCPIEDARALCDDRTDCPAGQVCCAMERGPNRVSEALCSDVCVAEAGRVQALCDPTDAISCADQGLAPCSSDDQSIFRGYAYCHER